MPPQHVGLGTKTALILAAVMAANVELELKLDAATLQSLSGRGGTSGIGIHGFFTGGFLVDAGHPQAAITSLSPSSSRRANSVPMLVLRLPIPLNWRFHLVLPPGTVLEGSAEAEFFANNTPISEGDAHEAISLAYHGLMPAVREADLKKLQLILGRIHKIGFKASELAAQTPQVRDVYHRLLQTSMPVGLSSLGPLLYVVIDDHDKGLGEAVRRISADSKSLYLGAFAGLPEGYTILS
jgi:beta-ribofuranosylaminobenzene 5'-phosphate synthase